MAEIFIGSEAVANGVVSRYELQRWYRPIYPDVHAPRGRELTLRDRTVASWLWSKRSGIVTGVAASALHGAQWVDPDVPIELLWNCTRPPSGTLVRNETFTDDEITRVDGIPVTIPARTAFDLGRHLPRGAAIARLDALMYATPFSIEEVLLLAKRYRGGRGVQQLKNVLPLVDGGAASPKETWLRCLFIDAGLPKPTTQIPVVEGHDRLVRMFDMGWEDFMVAAEYDGDQHRTNRRQYVKDLRSAAKVEKLGWKVVRVCRNCIPAGLFSHFSCRNTVSRKMG